MTSGRDWELDPHAKAFLAHLILAAGTIGCAWGMLAVSALLWPSGRAAAFDEFDLLGVPAGGVAMLMARRMSDEISVMRSPWTPIMVAASLGVVGVYGTINQLVAPLDVFVFASLFVAMLWLGWRQRTWGAGSGETLGRSASGVKSLDDGTSSLPLTSRLGRAIGLSMLGAGLCVAWVGLISLLSGDQTLVRLGFSFGTVVAMYLAGGLMAGVIGGALDPLRKWLVGRMLLGFLAFSPMAILVVLLLTPVPGGLPHILLAGLSYAAVMGPLYGVVILRPAGRPPEG